MEFDINLILVPITLVLLLAYLADKLVLKQHKLVKDNCRLLNLAQSHFDDCQKAFKQGLKSHYGVDDVVPEHYTPNANTPSDVLALHDDYHAAKRKLAECKAKVNAIKEPFLVAWAYEYLPILAVLVLVRAFILEPFNIPSSSMVPSLYTGDFIVVNKASYGLRLPIVHTKILNTGSPKHGDVVVFRYPLNEKRYYIKRVIGLPGDTVRYDSGMLSINGQKVATQTVNYDMDKKLLATLYPSQIGGHRLTADERLALGSEEEGHTMYRQERFGEHQYNVRYVKGLSSNQIAPFLQDNASELQASRGQVWQITVPSGQYFVMGDNRERSEDSRFWGLVPEQNLAGRATYIWMHKEAGFAMPSFSRAGKID